MNKALVIGLGKQEDITNAFAKHFDTIYWDWTSEHKNFFHEYAISLQREHEPDIIFMQIQTPNIILPSTAKNLSKKSIIINWTGDVRSPLPEWFIDVGKHIHLTCFSNINDVIEARSRGIKSDYLQIGVPNKIFVPEGEISNKTTDIVFMGNNVGGFPLSKMRSDMVYLLKSRYGEKFKSFGIGFGEQITNQQEEASIYRGAKMAISLSHFNYTNYYSDRLLRIMGSGCLALSYNFEGITDEFTPNEHLLVWDNFENLVYLIDEFLNKNHDRKVIAKAGCEHVHEKHTWDNRIDQLIKLL